MAQMVQKSCICPMATLLVFWQRNWSPHLVKCAAQQVETQKPRPCHETTMVSLAAAVSWFVNSPRQMGCVSHAARTI